MIFKNNYIFVFVDARHFLFKFLKRLLRNLKSEGPSKKGYIVLYIIKLKNGNVRIERNIKKVNSLRVKLDNSLDKDS